MGYGRDNAGAATKAEQVAEAYEVSSGAFAEWEPANSTVRTTREKERAAMIEGGRQFLRQIDARLERMPDGAEKDRLVAARARIAAAVDTLAGPAA